MKTTFVCGLVLRSQSAKRRPLICGMTMSVSRRSIFLCARLLDQMLRVVAGCGLDYVVAKAAQNAHGNVAHADVIFEDENGFDASWAFCFRSGRL